ncbi:hypothetical protein RJ640_029954 [Escallonia rubra]|uniref:Uncharacterized protein n=1 Tax=Escallonia rubra TaxID=112253 RepID=A0AA88QWI5_9ASTE|nr:hypothetical protein RJ640_029954 [Escallonia rubra]
MTVAWRRRFLRSWWTAVELSCSRGGAFYRSERWQLLPAVTLRFDWANSTAASGSYSEATIAPLPPMVVDDGDTLVADVCVALVDGDPRDQVLRLRRDPPHLWKDLPFSDLITLISVLTALLVDMTATSHVDSHGHGHGRVTMPMGIVLRMIVFSVTAYSNNSPNALITNGMMASLSSDICNLCSCGAEPAHLQPSVISNTVLCTPNLKPNNQLIAQKKEQAQRLEEHGDLGARELAMLGAAREKDVCFEKDEPDTIRLGSTLQLGGGAPPLMTRQTHTRQQSTKQDDPYQHGLPHQQNGQRSDSYEESDFPLYKEEAVEELKQWEYAAVGYVLGFRPSFQIMQRFIERKRKSFGTVKLSLLETGVFIFMFENSDLIESPSFGEQEESHGTIMVNAKREKKGFEPSELASGYRHRTVFCLSR